MPIIEISEETHRELARVARPLIDNADDIILRLVRAYKRHNGPSSKNGAVPVTRKTRNPDDIKVWRRDRYKQIPYTQAIGKIIKEKQQPLGILSIVRLMFDFPRDGLYEDRTDRAIKSLLASLQSKSGVEIFKQKSHHVFDLK